VGETIFTFNYGAMHFHPVEKIIRLYEENLVLQERMLNGKVERRVRLEKSI